MHSDKNPFTGQEIWFVVGSQHLYGDEVLKQVRSDALKVVDHLDLSSECIVRIIFKAILTSSQEILNTISQANASPQCVGIIAWMHTFSPAKMWINGLSILSKPLLHLHTQFHREIPWEEIDMDYMNLHQSAHGGREFGHITTIMGVKRKVVVGHYTESRVLREIGVWSRVVGAIAAMRTMKVARFGDNMRSVAVTEGNKVSAQRQFGFEVYGYGLQDLTACLEGVEDSNVIRLVDEYQEQYQVTKDLAWEGNRHHALKEAARIELGMRFFLESGGFSAFTDTFENLGDLKQLPGLPVQRLMADGYGFGAEGDWKTAALMRCLKVMSWGLPGGLSFMEDYTYDFNQGGSVLGAHMLEICPSIAEDKPRCEIHPLGIGNRSDPVRLVFTGTAGPALNVSLVDLGYRFRLLVNEVDAIAPEQDLPKLPVARVLWKPKPDFKTAVSAWILAGGAHHTVYAPSLTQEYLEILADMMGIECLTINADTTLSRFQQDIRTNEVYFKSVH